MNEDSNISSLTFSHDQDILVPPEPGNNFGENCSRNFPCSSIRISDEQDNTDDDDQIANLNNSVEEILSLLVPANSRHEKHYASAVSIVEHPKIVKTNIL